ncbi:MAG TPA: hypothetical protein VEJ18_08315, partial [Planctomycetota bacterium]|nr:hypothetical protein [Planctomycetota bacterium]
GLLKDPSSASPHDEKGIHFYVGGRLQAIRMGTWKLRLAGKAPELFDLRADVGESRNVASEHPDVVERLRAAAERYDADLKANSRPAWTATGS